MTSGAQQNQAEIAGGKFSVRRRPGSLPNIDLDTRRLKACSPGPWRTSARRRMTGLGHFDRVQRRFLVGLFRFAPIADIPPAPTVMSHALDQ